MTTFNVRYCIAEKAHDEPSDGTCSLPIVGSEEPDESDRPATLFRVSCSSSCTIDRQGISFHITRMVRMAFDPLERGSRLQRPPLFHLAQDVLHQVAVLHRLPRRCLPSVAPPVDMPERDTVDGVSAVRDDRDIRVPRNGIECSPNRRQFGTLICLTWSW